MLSIVDAASPSAALAVETLDRFALVSVLEARELRLLACAVGDHLPVELAMQVRDLRARRAALELV
jgi:hypothetical protein